jgi:DNA-binding MarR family transcriptional regulator
MKMSRKVPLLDKEVLRLGWDLESLHGMVAIETFHHATTLLGGDLSLPKMVALFQLSHRSPQTITAIAAAITLSHAATSRMVDSLVKSGLVDRREGSEDRRQKLIALNSAGLECIQTFRRVTAEAYANLMTGISREHRSAFASALSEVVRLLPSPDARKK